MRGGCCSGCHTVSCFCEIDGHAVWGAGGGAALGLRFCKIDGRVLGGMQIGVLVQVLAQYLRDFSPVLWGVLFAALVGGVLLEVLVCNNPPFLFAIWGSCLCMLDGCGIKASLVGF